MKLTTLALASLVATFSAPSFAKPTFEVAQILSAREAKLAGHAIRSIISLPGDSLSCGAGTNTLLRIESEFNSEIFETICDTNPSSGQRLECQQSKRGRLGQVCSRN